MFASAEKAHVNGKARHINKTASRAARHVEEDAEDAISTIYGAAASIKEDVENLAQSAGRRVREVIDNAENSVVETTGNMTAAVRENPVQSSMIALGVGVVLGFLFRRS